MATTLVTAVAAMVVTSPPMLSTSRPLLRLGNPHIITMGSETTAEQQLAASAETTAEALKQQLAAIRELRPTEQSPEVQQALWKAAGLLPMYKVSGSVTGEPSFTQLFSHETWSAYTGKSPFQRWLRTGLTWRYSTVLASVWPICLFLSLWAYMVALLPVALLPRTSPIPLTLTGSAIGLLLVRLGGPTHARAPRETYD